jgi:hypothetical protein
LAVEPQVTADNGNLKFEFEISEYGVRLWKTIEGTDAPKNFTWNITKTEGTKSYTQKSLNPKTNKETTTTVTDDLKFRDNPEAFEVTQRENPGPFRRLPLPEEELVLTEVRVLCAARHQLEVLLGEPGEERVLREQLVHRAHVHLMPPIR